MQLPPTQFRRTWVRAPSEAGLFIMACVTGAYLAACSPAPKVVPLDDTAEDRDTAGLTDVDDVDDVDVDDVTAVLTDAAVDTSDPLDGKPSTPGPDAHKPDGQSTTVISRDTTTSGDAKDVVATLPDECETPSDCTLCAFPTAPASSDDCYCISCNSTVMTAAECTINQVAWDAHCTSELWPARDFCPQPRCLAPLAPICLDGQCSDGCAVAICPELNCPVEDQYVPFRECCAVCGNDSGCEVASDCTFCSDFALTESAEDCACRTCAKDPVLREVCTARAAGFGAYCDPWPAQREACDDSPCILDRSPIVCDRFAQCQPHPNRCRTRGECTACALAAVPTHPGECRCPSCPIATSRTFCEAATSAHTALCADFDLSQCPQVDCLQTGELQCLFGSGVCEFGPGVILERR